jgi:hypothetical protein
MDSLASDLSQLLASLAVAGPVERGLIATCPRCRNSMLYLMYPGSDKVGAGSVERSIAARIRALAGHHEGHGTARNSDDATPRFA